MLLLNTKANSISIFSTYCSMFIYFISGVLKLFCQGLNFKKVKLERPKKYYFFLKKSTISTSKSITNTKVKSDGKASQI